jgi:hypothetical protein
MTAQLAYLANGAREQSKYGLEAALITTAAEILTSCQEIAAASYAPTFLHRLGQAIERIELGLDVNGSFLRQSVAH